LEAAPAAPPPAPAPDGNDRRLHPVPPPPPPTVRPAAFPSLDEFPQGPVQGDIGLLLDVPLQVTVELGRTQLRIRNVLELVPGSIIELEKLSGEPVDVLVNGRQIARGEVVVIDEEFGVRITDIASRAARLRDVAG
jgi:flagellar motor switch protein FliN/FliY